MSAIKRVLSGGTLSALAITATLLLTISTAHAHFVSIYHGSDNAYTAANDHTVFVCDHENDGHSVYTEQELTQSPYFDTTWDSYGGDCAIESFVGYMDRFRICEVSEGCSAWRAA